MTEARVVESLFHLQPSARGRVVRQDRPRHSSGEGKAETVVTMPPHEKRLALLAKDYVEDDIAVKGRRGLEIQT
jgi:hypothetical protein